MRITSKGQVTIPQDVRDEVGLLPHTEVEFVIERDGVRIVKARQGRRPTRAPWWSIACVVARDASP